jgi:hypothetical protein
MRNERERDEADEVEEEEGEEVESCLHKKDVRDLPTNQTPARTKDIDRSGGRG